MSDLSNKLQEEYEKLKTRRDELRVQLDLGKKEVEDAWRSADEKWGEFENKIKLVRSLGQQTAGEVKDAAGKLVEETREGVALTLDEAKQDAQKLVEEVREGFNRLRNV